MEHTIFEPNPMEAHGTRDTKRPQHTSPLKKNCSARKRRQFNRAGRDAKTAQSEAAEKKTSPPSPHADKNKPPYSAQAPTTYTHKATSTTSAIDVGVVSSNHHVQKKPDRSTCAPTRKSHIHGSFGMATCTLCRQTKHLGLT